MKKWNLALFCSILLWTPASHAGEALITKVRGSKAAIDMGAEAGLVVGMEVSIVRPPGEAIIHPITGENLGAPEIELGKGEITKTSGRAASVRLGGELLMAVRPGDIVRFLTPEEEMIMDQERTTERHERNQEEHQEFKNEISRLTRGIRDIQGRIGGLERLMKRVERVEEGFKVQLRGINDDINLMKEDINTLKDQIALYGPVPIEDIGEQQEGAGEPSMSKEDVEQIVRDVVGDMQASAPPPPLPPSEELPPLPGEEEGEIAEPEEEGTPFYMQSWFFGIIGAVGIVGVVAYLYVRMTAGSEEDEEDEEIGEDEDMEEMDVDVEEEDGIVIEETP